MNATPAVVQKLYTIARTVYKAHSQHRWFDLPRADAIQVGVTRCLEHLPRFDETRASFSTYMSMVARHAMAAAAHAERQAKDGQRRSLDAPLGHGDTTLSQVIPGEYEAPEDVAARNELVARIRKIAMSLPPETRVLLETDLGDLSKVARERGVTPQAISAARARAIAYVRQFLKEEMAL